MAIGVRDYLENLGHTVGYDKKTGDVLVKNEKGKMTSIGSGGFTLNDDGRYYAESEGDILSALSKSGISAKIGYSPVRSALSPANTVSYNEKTGQVYINGRDYNVDGKNLINIGGMVYGENDFIKSLEKNEYKNQYAPLQEDALNRLLGSSYKGYNPENDKNYQMAYDSFMTDALADMGERGLISDSLTTHYAAQGAAKLMPQFAELDYQRYLDEKNDLKDALDIMGKYDENDRQAYSTNESIRQNEMSMMQDRDKYIADEIYRNKAAEREEELFDKAHQNDIELFNKQYQSDMEQLNREYQYKNNAAQRDFEYEKELLRLQNDLNMSRDEAKAYLKLIYG